ncbi:NlpC/P60 family protein [Flavobacterium sp.]|uniref:C40 family peptidase n=1 Tax=Flavobacterium sp. TaxID=239 RepID=UPI0035294ADD
MFGICNLAIVPVRLEPSDKSEQVTQLLFGESFAIIEQIEKWVKIKISFDDYVGWIDKKQFQELSEEQFLILKNSPEILNTNLIEYVSNTENELIAIPLGSSISFLDQEAINRKNFIFEGAKTCGVKAKTEIAKTAFMYLNTPYLWGGKSPFGIDCSGFTQMVYKLNGYTLFRDASQQATQGEALSFIEESEAGDLAFFDNENGVITHVGIVLNENYIIHASGKVRIDRLDHLGIYNAETNKHTHKLRVIKRIM